MINQATAEKTELFTKSHVTDVKQFTLERVPGTEIAGGENI